MKQNHPHSIERSAVYAWIGLALVAMLIAGGPSDAGTSPRRFMEGLHAYEKEAYADAIEHFLALIDAGIQNGKLYYNLGNAYLKNEDLGPAILWYERARKLTPGDPDLNFNLSYARTLTKDQYEETTPPIIKILFFWKYRLHNRTVQWIAIGLNLLFWTGLVIRRFGLFKTPRTVLGVLAALSAVLIATALYNHYETNRQKQGIILPPSVAIRSGFADDATVLFSLHGGTRVKIDKVQREFYRIQFAKGKIGWIKQDQVGRI